MDKNVIEETFFWVVYIMNIPKAIATKLSICVRQQNGQRLKFNGKVTYFTGFSEQTDMSCTWVVSTQGQYLKLSATFSKLRNVVLSPMLHILHCTNEINPLMAKF